MVSLLSGAAQQQLRQRPPQPPQQAAAMVPACCQLLPPTDDGGLQLKVALVCGDDCTPTRNLFMGQWRWQPETVRQQHEPAATPTAAPVLA